MADRQSQSSSKASSAASSSASVAGESFHQQAFPAIFGIDGAWPAALSHTGIILEGAQLSGLLLTAVWPVSPVLKMVGTPLYFTSAPFWDRGGFPGAAVTDFHFYQIFVWSVVACIITLVGLFILHVQAASVHADRFGTPILRVLVALVGGPLFQPFLHILLAAMVCHPDTAPSGSGRRADGARVLAAFPDQQCFTGLSLAVFIAGTISLGVIVCVRFAVTCMMFDDTPVSQHPRARGSSFSDVVRLMTHIIVVVLYHILVPLGALQLFAALVAIAGIIRVIILVRDLPYYSELTARLVCALEAVLVVTATQMASTLVILSPDESWTFDSAIWFVLCASGAAIGATAAQWRVSGHCLRALAWAVDGRVYRSALPRYPSGLPREERVKYRELEVVITAQLQHFQEQDADALAQFELHKDQISVMQPYLENIFQDSDVEAAARFLRLFVTLLRTEPSSRMVAFALRIYTKGMGRFGSPSCVMLHFAHFLSTYVPSHVNEALQIIGTIDKLEFTNDISVTYRAARRASDLMGSMLIQDASQKKAFMAAQRMHREALLHMNTFWAHLLDDHTDVAQLAVLAKTITDRREQGLALFRRVVTDQADQSVLVRYAQFLEQVLMDNDGATQVREYIVDQVEKNQMQRDNATTGAVGNAALLVQRRAQSSSQGSKTLAGLRVALSLLFIGSVAVVVGLILFGVFFGMRAIRSLENIHEAGKARRLSQQAWYLVDSIAAAAAAGGPSAASTVEDLQQQLHLVADSFRTVHLELTSGKYQPTEGALRWLYTVGWRELRVPDGTHLIASLWTMGASFTAALDRVSQLPAATVLTTPAEFSNDVIFVRDNALTRVGTAYNESLGLLTDSARDEKTTALVVLAVLFVTGAFICAVYYGVLIYNFGQINTSKLSTLSLFTLIPKTAVEKLRLETRQLINNFDAPDSALEQKLLERGLASDQAERMAEIGDGNTPEAPVADQQSKVSGKSFTSLMQNLRRAEGKMLRHGAEDDMKEDDPYLDGDELFAETEWDCYDSVVRSAEAVGQDQDPMGEEEDELDSPDVAGSGSASDPSDGIGGVTRSFTESSHRGSNQTRRVPAVATLITSIVLGAVAFGLACWLLTAIRGADGLDLIILGEIESLEAACVERTLFMTSLSRFVTNSADSTAFAALGDSLAGQRAAGTVQAVTATQSLSIATTIYDSNDAWVRLSHIGRVAAAVACAAASAPRRDVAVPVPPEEILVPPAVIPTVCVAMDDKLGQLSWDISTDPILRSLGLELGSCGFDLRRRADDLSRLTAEQLMGQAMMLTFGAPTAALFRKAQDPLGTLIPRLRLDAQKKHMEAMSTIYFISVGVVVAGTLAAAAHAGHTVVVGLANRWVAMLMVLSVVSVSATVPLTLIAQNVVAQMGEWAQQRIDAMEDENATRSQHFMTAYNVRGAALAERVFDVASSAALLKSNGIATPMIRLTSAAGPNMLGPAARALRAVLRYDSLMRIPLALSSERVVTAPDITTIDWNFELETDAERLRLQFPDQQFYSSRASDMALDAAKRKELAWRLLSGPWIISIDADFEWNFDVVVHATFDKSRREYRSTAKRAKTLSLAVIFTLMSSLGAAILAIVVSTLGHVSSTHSTADSSRNGSGATSSVSPTSRGSDTLFDSLARRSRVSLIILAATIAVVCAFGAVAFSNIDTSARDLNAASLREYGVAQTMAIGQLASQSVATVRGLIAERLEELRWATDNWYYGPEGAGPRTLREADFHAAGRWNSVDESLFGTETYSKTAQMCSAPWLALPAGGQSAGSLAVANGADVALRFWRKEIAALIREKDSSMFSARLATLKSNATAVLEKVIESTERSNTASVRRVRDLQLAFLICAGLLLCLVVGLFAFVFRPMLALLLHEEEGTKLMLRMIPEDVRQTVPAIAEYLRRGVILQDTKLQEINEAMTEMSTIPSIAIDFQGRILRFSRAAEETFGWQRADVIGKNIKILMPENIAVEHDQYLENYYRTGVKHVIGIPRRVRAMRSDGTVFPAEIIVREVKSAHSTIFVGTVKNIVVDIEFEKTIALSKAVSEVAPVPIIVINSMGIVQRFNSAAEHVFKCSAADVVKQNITRLMTTRDAERHDGFLERYRQTGEKRIINRRRPVRCRRRTGEVFVAMISVVELVQEHETLFIGYVEDHTKQINVEIATTINDAIAQTAPVPLVAISQSGMVEQWNPAAARVFKLSAAEIVGRNVKMLMPDNIAAKHDGYLNAYLRTGRKTILDAETKTKAKRASDSGTVELFPIVLAVKEIHRGGKPNYYVAYLQDCSVQSQLAVQHKVADAIIRMSITPIVLIQSDGIVLTFSKAAEDLFGYSAGDVVGENVKRLMPSEFAERHDALLAEYITSRKKKVVDTTRHVPARLSSGEEVPVELAVKEVIYEGESLFVGFLRSVADDIRMRRENAINNAVSQLSIVPMIVINDKGTILSANDSACEKFCWPREEIINQNVKVLMAADVAAKHDGFLASYSQRLADKGPEVARSTSQILHRQRRVVAKTRDELTFHAIIHIRDLHVDGSPPVFVGTVRDISEDLERDSQLSVGTTIVETSTIPFIAMDNLGIVTKFSAAAERDFGYKREEVVGQNIKMLMPADIARHHDGYLRAYAKTGQKKIIDEKRIVQVCHKDGSMLPTEIQVRELFHKDITGNEVNEFIGFLRSLRQEYILRQANQINEVASSLSTVPIIMIDERGIVGDFNKAAEETFGFKSSDILQRNIKLLMPDNIANKHDHYLQQYRQSGVKHIIGTTRVLQARRRNGRTFSAEVSVREVIKEGQPRQFLGYVRDVTLQQELALQAKINSAIIDLTPTPLLVIDPLGIVSVFSRAAQEVFGYTESQVISNNIKMLMPEAIAKAHDSYLECYMETGVKHIIDDTRVVRAMHANGTEFPVAVTVKELLDSEGRQFFVGYVEDRTHQAEQEMEMAFANAVARASPVPIITIDGSAIVKSFSLAAERVFGWTAAEIVGQNVNRLQPPEVAVHHDSYLQRYLRTGVKHVVDSERRVIAQRKDSSRFPCILTVKELRPNPQKPPTYVGFARCVEQEEAVLEASREGTATLHLSPSPILVMTQRGIVTFVNQATLRVFEYEEEEIIGNNIKMLMPPAIATRHDAFLQRYLDTGEKTVIGATRRTTAMRRDGTTFPMEITVREVVVNGLDTQYIGCVTDMTHFVKRHEQLLLSDAVTELSSSAVIAIDAKGTILKFSAEAEKLFKYQASIVVGQNVKMLMPPEMSERHDSFLERYAATKEKHVVDNTRRLTALDSEGRNLNIELSVKEVISEGDTVFIAFVRDVNSTFDISSSAELNTIMVNQALQPLVFISTSGIVECMNDAGLSLFGFDSAGDIIGKNISCIIPESVRAEHDGYLKRYLETGKMTVIGTTRRTSAIHSKTGKQISIELTVRELKDERRGTHQFVGYLRSVERDIELDVAQRTNAAAMHLSKYGIVIIDRSGTILQFSRAALEVFDVPQEEAVVGRNIKILMPESVGRHHDDYLAAYRRTGKKTVVDGTKDVIARTFRGKQQISVTLKVKELSFTTTGLENVYVGFIERTPEIRRR